MRTCRKCISLMLLWLMFATSFYSCNQTEDGSYVPPITISEKINGEWVLNSVTQVDEITSKSVDLTGQLSFMSFAIKLQADDQQQPTTFSVSGQAPALLPAQGTWTMENNFSNSDATPARIFLYEGSKKTAVLTITATPGNNRVLEFKFTRKQKGEPFVSYVYNLVPATAATK